MTAWEDAASECQTGKAFNSSLSRAKALDARRIRGNSIPVRTQTGLRRAPRGAGKLIPRTCSPQPCLNPLLVQGRQQLTSAQTPVPVILLKGHWMRKQNTACPRTEKCVLLH